MIFYFSGSGNSKHIAKRIGKHLGEQLIEITKGNMKKGCYYKVSKDERIGIVCPTYWYNMPILVEDFIKELNLVGYSDQYIYAVATYGVSSGNMLRQVEKALKKKGYPLSGKFGVRMVDNYVVGYDLVNEERQRQIISLGEKECDTFLPYIEKRIKKEITKKGIIAPLTPILKPFYKNANHTKKFYATKECVCCGKCERECPAQVISLKNGMPSWSGECSFCLRCIHRCPTKAIQYGKGTLKRRRYSID